MRQARFGRARLRQLFACFLLTAAPQLGACGYTPLRVATPFGAQRVALAPFVETPVTGANATLTAHLAAALRSGGAQVVHDARLADGVLGGRMQVNARPGTTLSTVQVYNLVATAQAEWHDARGDVLWRCSVEAHESFLPQGTPGTSQPLATETQRRMALGRLTERLAADIYRALSIAQLGAPALPLQGPFTGPSGLDDGTGTNLGSPDPSEIGGAAAYPDEAELLGFPPSGLEDGPMGDADGPGPSGAADGAAGLPGGK